MNPGESTAPTQDESVPTPGASTASVTTATATQTFDDDGESIGNTLSPEEMAARSRASQLNDDGEEPGDNVGNNEASNVPASVALHGTKSKRERKRGGKNRSDTKAQQGAPQGQGLSHAHRGGGGGNAADQHRAFKNGDKVRAKIIALGSGGAMCDLWGKEKGVLDLRELVEPDAPEPQVGDAVDVIVLQDGSRGGGNLVVTRDPGRAERNREMVAQAHASGDAIEALITGFNRGGLEVDLGGVRGFCPSSQIDVRVPSQTELQAMVLTRELVKVTQLADNGREAVVSRRALREVDIRERAEAAVQNIKVGDRVKGRVVAVRDHGIFVDLGGVEGRIQLTELSHDRGARPQDIAKVGDEIEALVLRIDVPQPPKVPEAPATSEAPPATEAPAEAAPAAAEASPEGGEQKGRRERDKDKKKHGRFTRIPEGTPRVELSRRAIEVDPWSDVHKRYAPGSVHKGRVARMQPFGAFIELERGVDGLLHVSEIDIGGKRVQHPSEALKDAQELNVRVIKVDKGQRRIALSMVPDGVTEEQLQKSVTPRVGMVAMAKVVEHDNYGIWAQIEGAFGKIGRGFIAPPDSGQPRGADLKKELPVGADVRVKVTELDRGRMKLSIRAALQDEERQAYRSYQQQAAATSVGVSLADKLRKLNLGSR